MCPSATGQASKTPRLTTVRRLLPHRSPVSATRPTTTRASSTSSKAMQASSSRLIGRGSTKSRTTVSPRPPCLPKPYSAGCRSPELSHAPQASRLKGVLEEPGRRRRARYPYSSAHLQITRASGRPEQARRVKCAPSTPTRTAASTGFSAGVEPDTRGRSSAHTRRHRQVNQRKRAQ